MTTVKRTKAPASPAKKRAAGSPAKKTTTSTKSAPAKEVAAKKSAPVALDWAGTIKKAAAQKRGHSNWPDNANSWKKMGRS